MTLFLRRILCVALVATCVGVSPPAIADASSRQKVMGIERLATAYDRARYKKLVKLINRNRHVSAHLVMAVDGRTIKAVRSSVSERDIPILIAMLSDKDYGIAAAAGDILATQGMSAVPALRAVKRMDRFASEHARHALQRIQDCYSLERWDRMDPDACPADRAVHRGEQVPTELQ